MRVALSRRRARAGVVGVRPVRPPFPDDRPRAHRVVRRSRDVPRGGDRGPLRRPAGVLRPAPVRRAARRGGAEHRPRRGGRGRPGRDRRASGRARRDGLLVHGRLDGERRRGEVLARLRLGDRPWRAPRLGDVIGRRAHAGRDPVADAAAEDGVRRRGPPRCPSADAHGDGASDDGGRARVVCLARRRDDR